MPRSLATPDGRYTADEVATMLTRAVANRPDVTFEVYDRDGNLTDYEPVVVEASVEFDADRLIHGALSVTMEPIPAILDEPFRYVFRPMVGLGPMPDGRTAVHPWGRYLWTRPRSVTHGLAATNVEDWSVTMPDLCFIQQMNGPGLQGFVAQQSTLVTSAIARALDRSGEDDTSGVTVADELMPEAINWTLRGGPRARRRLHRLQYIAALRAWKRMMDLLDAARAIDPHTATPAQRDLRRRAKAAANPEKPTRSITRDLDERGMRWLDVLSVLHDMLGYDPPHRDMDGLYIAQPTVDASEADPEIVYRTGPESVIISKPEMDPDLSGLANVVYVTGTSSSIINPGTVLGVADLRDLIPTHPLARSGDVIEDIVEAASALSQQAADAQARRELFASLLAVESVTFETTLNPQHVGFDALTLGIEGHAEYDTDQVMLERSWSADLVRGSMRHQCARVFRAVGA